MLSNYLVVMSVVIGIIAIAMAIGQLVRIVKTFREYGSGWEKLGSILNLVAILTVGSAVVTLFCTVSGLL